MASRSSRNSKRVLPHTPGNSKENVYPFITPASTPVSAKSRSNPQSLFGTPDCYNSVTFGTPLKRKASDRYSNCSDLEEDGFSVTVAVRVRPFSQREIKSSSSTCIIAMQANETFVKTKTGNASRFCYDHCFWSFDRNNGDFADQTHVYRKVGKPLLISAFEGYNTCLFAYGQTGSGKSYSIMGYGEEKGIIPQFTEELFTRIENPEEEHVSYDIEISFFEIYNEKIHDLLATASEKGRKSLRVREHPTLGPYVEGLSTYVAKSFADICGWIELGNKQRATASTGMNDKSSRSHSVFTIIMTKTKIENLEGEDLVHRVTSRINLIDLAGSERCTSAATSGDRLKEGASINKSLLTLGKVISNLCDKSVNKKMKAFIPYRESVLTWLLKDSLGGNAKTAMIATISPSSIHIEETLSTLRYAKQARSIINAAKVNEDPNARLIRDLRAEVEKLRRGRNGSGSDPAHQESLDEIKSLKEQLNESEQRMAEATKAWQDKLQQSERNREKQSRGLEKSGISLKVDNKLPNLVNLNEDPQLSEVLLYLLKEGQSTVGQLSKSSTHDIQLQGALVASKHCTFNNVKNIVSISPMSEADTYLNGSIVTSPTLLHHGDRIVIGDHYFRFNHPIEVGNGRHKQRKSSHSKQNDFEFAWNELISAQAARLESEQVSKLKEHQQAAQQELEEQKKYYEDRLMSLSTQLEKQNVDAKDKITKLQDQKRMLEDEILTDGKKLIQMEAIAKERLSHSHVIMELQQEKLRMEKSVQRLHKLKLQHDENKKTTTVTTLDPYSSRLDLLRLSIHLQEANNISKTLKKHTILSRHDVPSNDVNQNMVVRIRVNNSRLAIVTYWSLDKFEEKLLHMRELYQSGDSEGSHGEDVFYDPNDSWQKDHINLPSSMLPGTSSSVSSLSSQQSIPRSSQSISSSPSISGAHDGPLDPWPLPHLCREALAQILTKLDNFQIDEYSVADELLLQMQTVLTSVNFIEIFQRKKNDAFMNASDMSCCGDIDTSIVQATQGLQYMSSHALHWAKNLAGLEARLIQDLSEQLVDSIRKMVNNFSKMLQGCEGDIASMVTESQQEISKALTFTARIIGELAIATETDLITLDPGRSSTEENTQKIDCALKQGILDGADALVDRTIQGGIRLVCDCEERLQTTIQKAQEMQVDCGLVESCLPVVGSVRLLFMKVQETQFELASTMNVDESSPDQFYWRRCQRDQSVATFTGALADYLKDVSKILLHVINGQRYDLQQLWTIVNCIIKTSQQLAESSSTLDLLPWQSQSMMSANTSTQSNASQQSTASMHPIRLSDLVLIASQQIRSASQELMAGLETRIERDRHDGALTPTKGKRTLPSAPEVSHASRVKQTVTVADLSDV